MLNKLTTGCLILIIMLAMALGMAQPAQADAPPAPPHQLYGTVTVNDNPAPPGTAVSIRINGTEVASAATNAQGKYGYSPTLKISGSSGATMEFYVNGVKAQQTYTLSSGAVTNLNLTTGAASPPPPPPPATPAPEPPTPTPTPTQTPTPTPTQTPSPSPTVTVSSSVLGQAGSISISQAGVLQSATTVSSADGAVQLSFKANTTVNIQGQSLAVTRELSPPSPPADTAVITAYKFSPSETTFKPALTLTVKYDPAALPAGVKEAGLFIAYWDGSKWAALSSTVDTQAKTMTAQVSHFSTFAVLGMVGGAAAPKPASFAISDLKVSPSSVTLGETVTIAAAVTNSGGSQGSYTVVLKINGTTEAEDEVTLGAGETGVVTFTVSKESAGSYSVAIDGKSSSFKVSEAGTTTSKLPLPPIGVIVLALGGLLIIILIVVMARRRA
ncbi:MAG: hypothetical protein NTW48_01045 [Chloroflexi bacterium]|nr:hypothetical protein [Chloroflexota bacterium]